MKFGPLHKLNLSVKRLITSGFALVIILSTFTPFYLQVFAAVDGSIYITPSSTSLENATNKTFTIKVDTGSNDVNAVQAVVNYDTSKLSFVSMSADTANFPFVAVESHNSGTITISSGTAGNVNGVATIGSFTLKAQTGSGTALITVDKANSAIVESAGATDVLSTVTGSTIALTSPPSGGGGSSGGGSSGGSSGGGSSGGSNGGTTANDQPPPSDQDKPTTENAPKLVKDSVYDIGFNVAKANVKTNIQTRAVFEFGIVGSDSFPVKLTSNKYSTSHTFELGRIYLDPGITYQYRYKLIDKAENTTVSDTKSFTTHGYNLKIRLINSSNEPYAEKSVTINSQSQTGLTDSDGHINFTNVSDGQHTLYIDIDGNTIEKGLTVKDTLGAFAKEVGPNASAQIQEFEIVIDSSNLNLGWLTALAQGLAIATLLVLIIFFTVKTLRLRREYNYVTGVNLKQPPHNTADISTKPTTSSLDPRSTVNPNPDSSDHPPSSNQSSYQVGQVISPTSNPQNDPDTDR